MERVAFKMKLKPDSGREYQQRHDLLWPELRSLLKNVGVSDYSIFLDEETAILFGVLKVKDIALFRSLPQNPVMQNWWAFMSDIMETETDHSPVTTALKEVFYLI